MKSRSMGDRPFRSYEGPTCCRVRCRTSAGQKPARQPGLPWRTSPPDRPPYATCSRGGLRLSSFLHLHFVLHSLTQDRKSTRLNSSHGYISYAVFCLKKKKQNQRKEN